MKSDECTLVENGWLCQELFIFLAKWRYISCKKVNIISNLTTFIEICIADRPFNRLSGPCPIHPCTWKILTIFADGWKYQIADGLDW